MEQDLLRGLATVFCMIGFACVVFWAYVPVNKERFEQDANLAFDWEDAQVKDKTEGHQS